MIYLLYGLTLVSIGYYLFALFSAKKFFTPTAQPSSHFHPPISILKPVCGMEPTAYDNFASFCNQQYPNYQIIFGVKEKEDPIIDVIQQIIQDFPACDIQLVICEETLGYNPKVNSLILMMSKAKHDFLLISDSDVRVGPTYLQETIPYMENPKVGIVTCIYRSMTSGWRSRIEALGYATDFIPGVVCARQLDQINWTLGCSVLIQKTALASIGGMQVLVDHIAEDHLMGRLITEAGYQIILAPYAVDHVLQEDKWITMIQRKIRWARGEWIYCPWGYLGLIFTFGTVSSGLLVGMQPSDPLSWEIGLLTWMTRIWMGRFIGAKQLKDATAKRLFWLSPLTDYLSFIIWVSGFFITKVYWKHQYYKVEKDGRLILIENNATTG